MAGHQEASAVSRVFCDVLFQKLQERSPRIERDELEQWCALYRRAGTRFAYVSHKKRLDDIEVWCRGDPKKLRAHPGINYRIRERFSGGWTTTFPGRFYLGPEAPAFDAAVEALIRYSFPESTW